MIKLINNWIFVNYCGQKIGQFKGADLKESLFNVIMFQIINVVMIPIASLYFFTLEQRNFIIFMSIVLAVIYIARKTSKSIFYKVIKIKELEYRYKGLPRKYRIINFIIAIILTGGSTLLFIFSFAIHKYL